MTSTDRPLNADEIQNRIVEPDEFVADASAFVDVRLPKSQGKLSYSFVGPGVSQNPDQVINITEPHGFNIGAAALAPGLVNNPHLHFTAEVFICRSGRWRFDVGASGDQHVEVGPGDVFSVPTWIFRGFTNIGDDDGFVYTVLGGDDTGGILWAPDVLRRAADTGLYLSTDGSVIEAEPSSWPADAIAPLTDDELSAIATYSDDELASRLVSPADLSWSDRGLLASVLPSHRTRLAPVIGFGMSQERTHLPPIPNRHGFAVDWLEIEPGCSIGTHRFDAAQVIIAFGDGAEIRFGREDGQRTPFSSGAVVSVPKGTWRDYFNTGSDPLRLLIVSQGDVGPVIEWSPEVVEAALDSGWTVDPNGCVGLEALISIPRRGSA